LEEIKDPKKLIRILIVDDHPNTATMLARVLSKFEAPVEVITASNGEIALEKLGDQPLDILITDFMMPGLNGLELIENLKEEQKPTHTILITAYDTPGLAITARRLNVHDYLVKPVQPETIRGIVSRVIEDIRSVHQTFSPEGRKSFKILIADDYPDNLRLCSARLRSEGYTFIAAWDGDEALEKVREENPDLVLLDVSMPKKDGFQVLEEIRADPRISHIPVIIVTAARVGQKDVREGLALGADDYVIKPFDWQELAARIRSRLRVKEVGDVLRRRNKDLCILQGIAQVLSARLDVNDLSNIVISRIFESLEAYSARLDLFQPDGSVDCRQRMSNEPSPSYLNLTGDQALSQGLIKHVLNARAGLVVNDISQDQRWRGNSDNGSVSAVAVPLFGRHDVIGVLTLTHNQPFHFNHGHQELLQAIANQAAIAIENDYLFNNVSIPYSFNPLQLQ
jgi:CheY-like chemotaxis protein